MRLSKHLKLDLDLTDTSGAGGAFDDDLGRSAVNVSKPEGDEFERLGADRPGLLCWGGGNRKDLVDHVLTRLREVSDVPSGCKPRMPPSFKNEFRSSAGVEGGARGDANTSNWRERYVREFISVQRTVGTAPGPIG